MAKTVLVADDSLTIRKVIGMVFSTDDIQITNVDNGNDAITRCREIRPDLVMADVTMPGKSGYEVCESLKADPATESIPVLLLAGTFEPFDEARARSVGATDFIVKPFESQALINKVKAIVGDVGAAPQKTAGGAPAGAAAGPRPSAPLTGLSHGTGGLPKAPTTAPGGMTPRAPSVPPTRIPQPMPGPAGIPRSPQPMMPAPARPTVPQASPPPGATRPTLPGMPPPAASRPSVPGIPGPPGAPWAQRPPAPAPGAPLPGAARQSRPPGQPMPGMPMRPGDPFGFGAPPVAAPRASIPPSAHVPAVGGDGGEAALRAAISGASREIIEKIAWEVVPQLAETIIRENLERLLKERGGKS